jgi:hypothetical protein
LDGFGGGLITEEVEVWGMDKSGDVSGLFFGL